MPPFALSDHQLETLMNGIAPLDRDKRGVALERIAAQLRVAGIRRPTDADLKSATASCTARRGDDGMRC
jgi:hypothetical protein